MATDPDSAPPPSPPRPTLRGAAMAGAYGAVAASLAYVIGRGNPVWMLVIMVLIGVGFRLCAYQVIRRRGPDRPPWWKWL